MSTVPALDFDATSTDFYARDDYFAVLDLPAEFYLETVQIVFQEFRLARGELEFRGRLVDPVGLVNEVHFAFC